MAAKNSPPLAELQNRLRRAFTNPQGIQADVDQHPDLLQSITEAPPLPAIERLGVYSEAYFLRILDSLETDFPATRRELGADPFRQLAADYLQTHPSSSPNIGDIGEQLPLFAKTHSLIKEFPFLHELFGLEWAALEVIHTDRSPELDTHPFQNQPAEAWSEARIGLDPTVRLLETRWAIDRCWEKRRQPPKKRGKESVKCESRDLMLYRDTDGVQLRVIDRPRHFILRHLQAGTRLGTACTMLAGMFPDQTDTLPVMDWFAHWLRAGLIKEVEFNPGS